jgi:3-deoxy-manno-octulosonate cytidylyltransferase (CMP-KDO synthetase)
MKVIGIIPARYASSRFPGKPLAMIDGVSMLKRVYDQAKKAKSLDEIVIATDDTRIMEHAASFGAKAVMTKAEHPSGTDRCYEAYVLSGKKQEYILNIQGDEPFLDPQQIDSICALCDGKTEIATQMIKCKDPAVLFDQGEVKITLNKNNEALYFSRNVIPHIKGQEEKEWHLHFDYYRHVGMYVYRNDILEQLCQLSPSSLEKAESLEQLRWLENGYKIKCALTSFDSHCIDTPEDVQKVLKLIGK